MAFRKCHYSDEKSGTFRMARNRGSSCCDGEGILGDLSRECTCMYFAAVQAVSRYVGVDAGRGRIFDGARIDGTS
jgi:hypothetical protein